MNKLFNKIFTLLLLLIAVLAPIRSFCSPRQFDLYYFNPDSIQSNFSLLNREIDVFYKQAGLTGRFQAFTQKVDFDRMVKEKQPSLVFIPAWYYQQYGNSLELIPLLVPLHNGKPTYTKVLLMRRSASFSSKDLAGRTVAMTSMGPNTEKMLTSQFFKDYGLDFSASNIITTPKDADALFALALGQVDAALVGQATLAAVAHANQRISGVVKELIASSPVPMPLLCAVNGNLNESEINKLKQVFMDGGKQSSLPAFMEMLQINGWQNAQK
ncbi:MAG: phosphate/phosphite/phosphonate ABC transporter substrate-binding protein [Desulfobulbaceae bacterium]|nr:phosphate/phosphite/phosphonate ABC transporter substrate-binding protein [Desulfobulbaceae bacterium]